MSTTRLGIQFEEGLSGQEKADILLRAAYLSPTTDEVQPDLLDKLQTVVVTMASGLTPEDTLSAVALLPGTDGIESANPVYRARTENESLLTDYFYVSVAAAADIYRQIERKFEDDGLEVFAKNDYSNIGVIGYRVKVTKAAHAVLRDDLRGLLDLI